MHYTIDSFYFYLIFGSSVSLLCALICSILNTLFGCFILFAIALALLFVVMCIRFECINFRIIAYWLDSKYTDTGKNRLELMLWMQERAKLGESVVKDRDYLEWFQNKSAERESLEKTQFYPIWLSKETKEKLKNRKQNGESYEDIINRLLEKESEEERK